MPSFLLHFSRGFPSRMLLRMTLQLVAALGLLVLMTSAHAINRLALVIGNDAYQNVPTLRNARNDAKLMASTLKSAAFDVKYVENLDRTRLWAEIDRFKNRIQKGDEVVFYFAGHGVQIGANQLLLPVDITAQNDRQVERDGVPLIDIQDALKDARTAVFVIDACRDNPFPKVGSRSIGATRGLAPPDVASGQIVILAAGRNQRALDDVPGKTNQNGLFTHELVQVIQSGNPEIRSAFEQVKQRVDDTAKRNGHEQRPSVVSDLNGNFYFFTGNNNTIVINRPVATVPPAVPAPDPAIAAEAEAYQAALKADVPEGYEQYLKDFPQARNASAIRIRLAAAKRKDLEASQQRDRQAAVAPALTSAPTPPPVVAQAPATPVAPRPNPLHPAMVRIPAGSLARKSASAIPIAAFDIGETEVTTAQYMACVQAAQACSPPEWDEVGSSYYLKGNGRDKDFYRGFTDAQQPIVGVSWFNAQQYVKWLSAQTGQTFRLPKESEWEYAAWGGTSPLSNSWAHGNGEAELKNYGWYALNSSGKSKAVKTLRANGFGLYDMAGNVWEWVQDCRTDSMPANGSAAGQDSDTNCSRVLRGGSWDDSVSSDLSPSFRVVSSPDFRDFTYGFRVARTVF